MAIVVCRFCNVTVRVIPPLKNAYKVKGLCSIHVNMLREDAARIKDRVNYASDILESCLKTSLQPRRSLASRLGIRN